MNAVRRILWVSAALFVAGVCAIVWLGSNFALRPPWYTHRTPEQGLLPATDFMLDWNWAVGDPRSDLGLAFEEVDYALGPRAMKRVAVFGSSQGGASVLLAAAADPRIDAVIAENPFTSIHALIMDNSMEPRLPRPLLAAISYLTRLRLGALGAPDPVEVVDRIAPRPLLLMHGDADRVIPLRHSQQLFERAGEPKQFWVAEGAHHAALFNAHPDEWAARVLGFLGPGMAEGPGRP